MNCCLLLKNKKKSKNDKQGQKRFDHTKQSVTGALKTTSKRVTEKLVAATGDFIDNKTADKVIETASRCILGISSQTDEESIEIPKEKYISPGKR